MMFLSRIVCRFEAW